MQILMTANATWNIWNFRRPLVEALLDEGHQVTVLAPPDDAISKLEHLGCRFRPLRMSVQGLNPLEELKLQYRFGQMFGEEQPDAVLSFTIKNNIMGARAAQSSGVPFLPNVTGLGTSFMSGKLLQTVTEQLYRRSFAALPVVFFQNKDDLDLFLDRRLVGADQAWLLPGSGIDLQRFAPAPMPAQEDPPVFLMISRLLRDKGVMEFVQAARRVKAHHQLVRFQLLGAIGSENRTALDRQTIDSWVSEGVVEYLGTKADVRPAIAAASCVVLPSYREGAPRTLMEAAAMARPLIATDVPGCRAVLDHDVSGILCNVRSAESLADAMERFLAFSPGKRWEMGAAGRAKMEREFDQALVVDAYRSALDIVTTMRRRIQ
jgi:glycosyltransferase involved in cell wall biosynthesis